MFVGTIAFVFKLNNPTWPDEYQFFNTWPVEDGSVTMWSAPDRTFIAVFQPNDGATYWIQTSPMIFDTDDWEFRIALRYSDQDADIFINAQLAATNKDGLQVDRHIKISLLENKPPGFDRNSENEDCRIARENELTSIVTKDDRRTRTIDEEVRSLRDGCKQLEDILNVMSEGKTHFDTAISNRLRALVCRFDRGPSSPLLQRVAGAFGLPLILYAPPFDGLNEEHPLAEGMTSYMLGLVTPEPKNPIQVPLDIDVWLRLKHAKFDGISYSNNEVLRAIADTSGSHYDAGALPLVDYLNNMKISNVVVSAANQFLVSVSECVIYLANFVVREAMRERPSILTI